MKRALAILVALQAFSASALAEEPVEVEVHEQKSGRASRRDPSAASTVIEKKELERPGADAAQIVARVPGAQVSQTGSSTDFATASLRGATSAETPVYLAGIRLNDDVTGTADLSRVPLWMLERVEVFRGSAPEDVDRLGMGGAILFVPRFPKRTRVGGGIGFGSFGERSAFIGGSAASETSRSLAMVRRELADNDYQYRDDRGTAFDASDDRDVKRQNADSDSYDVWAIGEHDLGPGAHVTTVLNGFRREQGVTGIGVNPARSARARVERLLAGVSTETPCSLPAPGEPLGDCVIELSTSALAASQTVSDPARELAIGGASVTSRGERIAEAAHLVLQPVDSFRLRAGASAELERLRIDPSTGVALRARRTVGRADVGAKLRVSDPLELGALGALECHGTDGPNLTTRCNPFAPSGRLGGVVYVASGLSVLANVGESLRVPTLGELYGSSAFVLGNEDLKPERGIAADLGLRFSYRKPSFELWSEAFGFARRASDLIAYRRSSLGVVRPYNIGRARILGLELATGVDALRHLSAEANATLLDPRDVTPGRTLTNDLIPFQSRLVANGSFELYAEPTRVANRVAAGARASYRASRAADPAGLIIIAEQWLFGLDASASFWQRRLTTRIAVDNVFDRAHVDAIGYPLPGRSWHASGELWW